MTWLDMAKASILVVDDERKIAEIVVTYLLNAGYAAEAAFTGCEALAKIAEKNYRLIILDLMLPDMSGEEVCRLVRRTSDVPVIMLTAKSAEGDELAGFRSGTDDYVTKPFSPRALTARVKALLKRGGPRLGGEGRIYDVNQGDLVVDTAKHEARRQGRTLTLTPSEYRLLLAFVSSPGRVFSREDLVRCALGEEFQGFERTVDTHIKNLRRKLAGDGRNRDYIATLHGIGYRFNGEGDADQS